MKELAIAANMIALARNRKGASKRSAMLRMIMPFLSKETGDNLASAIDKRDSAHFAKEWDKVKKEITARLSIHHKKNAEKHLHQGKRHKATGADVSAFPRDDGTSVCVRTYGAPEKIRININGTDVFEGAAPAESSGPVEQPVGTTMDKPHNVDTAEAAVSLEKVETANVHQAHISIDQGQTGGTYSITDPQIVELLKLVCERLLMGADPCPIPANMCTQHQYPNCRECYPNAILKPFDYNTNMLELHDRLVACKSL